PPACTTAGAVAKKVLVETRTSFPWTSRARRMISSELVPLLTATAWRTPQKRANFSSNSAPYLPSVKWPDANTSWMRSAIQARSSGRNCIFAAGTWIGLVFTSFTDSLGLRAFAVEAAPNPPRRHEDAKNHEGKLNT